MEIILKYITIPHSVIETNVLLCSELPIGTPLQYSCLENLMDGGGWWAAVHGVAKSRTRLSDFTFTFHLMSIESMMPSNHFILCCPLLLLPSIFPSIRVFSRVGCSHQVAKVGSDREAHV